MDFIEEVVVPVFIIMVIFILLIFVPAYFLEKESCYQYGEVTNKPVQFYALSGCYVKHGDEYINRKELRANKQVNK